MIVMKLNQGILYTNDNCIGCNRCIAVCPVAGANVASNLNEGGRIQVNNENCLHCGVCLEACRHNARECEDDTERFLEDLDRGEQISVLVEPAFFVVCADRSYEILGFLRNLGVNMFYDCAYGTDINNWTCLAYLQEHPMEGAVASNCGAVVNYIRKYSKPLQEKILPVQPPFLSMAVYVQKYLHNPDKLAYLGSCPAKSDEIKHPHNRNLVQYNINFHKLWAKIRQFDLSGYYAEPELTGSRLGRLCVVSGGISANINHFFEERKNVREVHGSRQVNAYLRELDMRCREGLELPFLAELLSCENGCLEGIANAMYGQVDDDVIFRVNQMDKGQEEWEEVYRTDVPVQERKERLFRKFADLNLEDFIRTPMDKEDYVGHKPVYKARLDAVFRSMHKDTPADRMVDCGSCGYNSCLEMATAIVKGYNTIENCTRYLKEENARLSLLDIRSGIPNMNAFLKCCEELIESEHVTEYTAILFCITNLRFLNLEYGVLRADAALKEYCANITKLTAQDELIAMLGDNNFVGLIRTQHMPEILDRLEKMPITSLVDELDKEPVYLRTQTAVYELDGYDIAPSMVLDKLSTTMSMLHSMPNRFVLNFDEKFQHKVAESEKLLAEMEPAILNHEFEAFFQPKVDMRTRKLVGAEALIRWRKEDVLISPGLFIPLAEKTGIVKKLDFYILNETCRRLKEWSEKGIELVPVSVNFSKKHFTEDTVADRIREVIRYWQVPPEYIEVEFTETAYLDDGVNLISSIDKLHEYGIRSSMDDFGAGYSSLSMLQNMSFDTLKLDRSFLTAGNCEELRCRTVISHIICMAKDLKMSIVSEGVETERELVYMKELGCDMAQGYLFDKPLPYDEFEKRLVQGDYPV